MFTKQTCFVIGAGVSKPFNFPVGKELKDRICSPHTISASNFQKMICLSLTFTEDGHQDAGMEVYHENDVKRFVESFGGSDIYSIDAWLEANQADRRLLQIGKRAIAAVILDAEATARNGGAPLEEDWFAWLWNNLWTPSIADLKKNKVDFVSFNYDRLFEWKLWQQIRFTYLSNTKQEHTEAYDYLRSKIVHVHGVVSFPRLDAVLLREYGEHTLHDCFNGLTDGLENKRRMFAYLMHAAAQTINIVCEDPQDDAQVKAAKKMITNDTRLVFLGFSFDKRNVLKLELDKFAKQRGSFGRSKDVSQRLDNFPIVGTGKGLMRGEQADIEIMFNDLIALGPENMGAVAFCRSYVRPN